MKHKEFEILRSEDQNNSLTMYDIMEERDQDEKNEQNTCYLSSINPCPLCQDDQN